MESKGIFPFLPHICVPPSGRCLSPPPHPSPPQKKTQQETIITIIVIIVIIIIVVIIKSSADTALRQMGTWPQFRQH